MAAPFAGKAALSITTELLRDEERRRTLWLVILTPVLLVFTFLFLCVYILLHPLEAIGAFLEEDIPFVEMFQEEFSDIGFQGEYPWPMDGARITSRYGIRDNPVGVGKVVHKGVDFRGNWHDPILTIADGEVVQVNTATSTYGNYIIIRHEGAGKTFWSMYAHLSEVNVAVGDEVFEGDMIGLEGGEPGVDPNPGRSTGHHLHFEIRMSEYGNQEDPLLYLRKGS